MNKAFEKLGSCFLVSMLIMTAPAAHAQNELPATTPEGMELLTQTRSRVVYAMPGATLDQYTKIALIDCYVAFRKDWERDYNRDASFDRRVTAADMERIKTQVAESFREVFTEVLTDAGREVVDHTGEDVLIIRPAIVNLDVTAPDVSTSAFNHVIVRSAGQMTLFMELYDSTTNAIIARVTDAQVSDRGVGFEANRVSNRAEADRILRRWAVELEGRLGEVQQAANDDD